MLYLMLYCLLVYAYTHDTIFYICLPDSNLSILVFACARHLASFYGLVRLLSDNPGLVCLDPEAWIVASFPVEDHPIRVRSESVTDQHQIFYITFLSGPS